MSREREREGRHVSIGGKAADEVLQSLVNQFSDPTTFIRELLQNSLDAGSARIDIHMTWASDELRVETRDDGDGMDRAIIEGYLLTLFRSTKEDDLTKIGKFGIGFTSIFAMAPFEVVVDTGRDGVWHRVTFDAQRHYTLSRLADPYEGTTVTLRIRADRADASRTAERIRDAAHRWCRYADATITVAAEGTSPAWDPVVIRAPFTVEAPVTVTVEQDGFTAVLGPHPAAAPPIGFYNRGITLWEAEEGLVPGVCFRVAGRHLEHTLTRDNVIRDRHFETVLTALRAAAEGALGNAVHAALRAASTTRDLDGLHALASAFGEEQPWEWDLDAPLLPTPTGLTTLAALRPRAGLLDRLRGTKPTLWWCDPDCQIGAALAATGVPVLVGRSGDAHLTWVARHVQATPARATDAWCFVEAIEVEPAIASLLLATGALLGVELRAARLHGVSLAVVVDRPGTPEPLPRPPPSRVKHVHVQVDHPLVSALGDQPAEAAAGILAVAIGAAIGLPPNPDAARAPGVWASTHDASSPADPS